MFLEFFKYFAILAVGHSSARAQKENPLNEKHLRIIAMEFPVSLIVKRNSTGHVVDFDGVLAHEMKVLSEMFNFSYSYLPMITFIAEDYLTTRGGLSYLANDEADLFLATSLATPSRIKNFDFPAPWFIGPFSLIVPYPKEMFNLKASFKPFSYLVWITIIIATLATILFLRILSFKWVKRWQRNKKISNSTNDMKNTRIAAVFVLGNLVSQGQHFNSNRLVYRVAAGAWCCACFFLVQIYCSTLSSHLISPNQKLIVNSLEELANSPDVDFTVDRGYGIDILLQTIETGIYKNLAEKLKRKPNLRCNVTTDCLNIVKQGRAVYSAPINNLKVIAANDLKTTGFCNYFFLMKESFLSSNIFNILQKNSPYTETVNIGILRCHQYGFYDVWFFWILPEPRKCMELERQTVTPRLSITHLSSAFVILLSGYIISIIAFVLEKIFHSARVSTKSVSVLAIVRS